MENGKTSLANDHFILENNLLLAFRGREGQACMLEQLSASTAISLLGAVRLLNIPKLITQNCSELSSDATAAFCEVLHLPGLLQGSVGVWFF